MWSVEPPDWYIVTRSDLSKKRLPARVEWPAAFLSGIPSHCTLHVHSCTVIHTFIAAVCPLEAATSSGVALQSGAEKCSKVVTEPGSDSVTLGVGMNGSSTPACSDGTSAVGSTSSSGRDGSAASPGKCAGLVSQNNPPCSPHAKAADS